MTKFGKWIGGGLGFTFGGPIGALIGFPLGAIIDNTEIITNKGSANRTTRGDFLVSLTVLIAAVLKADGKVLKSELSYVKNFLNSNFGREETLEALQMLKEVLSKEIPLPEVCNQIATHVNYSSRLQILHFLFGVANSDGELNENELRIIAQIANSIHIKDSDYISLKSMFVIDNNWAYDILEVGKDANDEDVKKAYRKMAMKYHPDKVSYLGEDIKKAAHEKFQKLNEAYEKIKKERNLN